MREIKFRAWDYTSQIMSYSDEEKSLEAFFASHNKDYDDVVFMQFTGLKDNRGCEIYEGDVLLCDDSNEDHEEFRTKVWFCNGQFLTQHYGFPVHSWCSKKESWCEVIGNIYENPELIKETK